MKKLIKFGSRKSKLSIYLNFFEVGHFFHEILHEISPFGTDISFTNYSGSALL